MDALFQATYRVEKVLEGKLVTGSEVTFTVADHYGFPKFAEHRRALIFLDEHNGSYYHIKYQWAPAFRTNEGDFAQCGCDVEDEDLQDTLKTSSDCRLLSFSPAVTQDLTHSSQYVIDKLRAGLDYKIQETTPSAFVAFWSKTCTSGCVPSCWKTSMLADKRVQPTLGNPRAADACR